VPRISEDLFSSSFVILWQQIRSDSGISSTLKKITLHYNPKVLRTLLPLKTSLFLHRCWFSSSHLMCTVELKYILIELLAVTIAIVSKTSEFFFPKKTFPFD
jgi:hypothetical protein